MTAYSTFRDKLADEYKEFDEWRRLAEGAGLEPRDLHLRGASKSVIANILRMVQRQEKFDDLRAFLADDNPHLVPPADDYISDIRNAGKVLRLNSEGPAFKRHFVAVFLGLTASLLGFGAFLSKDAFGLFYLFAAVIVTAINLFSGYAARTLLWQGRTDVALVWAQRATLTVLVILSIGAGHLWYEAWRSNQQPNFIIGFHEDNQPVVRQKVYLEKIVTQGTDPNRHQNETNETGQVYFLLKSGALYSGGIRIDRDQDKRDCVFPAFVAQDHPRSIDHDVDKLQCEALVASEAPSITRVSTLSIAAERPVAIDEARLNVVRRNVLASNEALGVLERRRRAPFGAPSAPIVVDHLFYTLGFDPAIRSPRWVLYRLEASEFVDLRRRDNWQFDPLIPREMQTGPEAYTRNPYDKGHLVPRRDASTGATEAQARASSEQVYFYSAIVPQAEKTNRLSWLMVEKLTTELSENHGAIYVIAGPVYPDLNENTARLAIGPDNTVVPLALFRVLLRQTGNGSWRSVGFLVPNDGSTASGAEEYLTSVEQIEKQTGLRFFPDLPGRQKSIKRNASLEAFRE